MYKQFMAKIWGTKPIVLAMACASLLLMPTAHAGKADFKLPIKVDSKSQFVDGKTKTSIFKNDVHVTQGSLSIDADEVEVIAGQGEGNEIFIARGKPATYAQTMDDGSRIKAVANEIKYQVSNRTLTLLGTAELHQNSSMVSGESIIFNMEEEQLLAQGTGTEDGRVTTVFQPDSFERIKDQDQGEKDSQESQNSQEQQDNNP